MRGHRSAVVVFVLFCLSALPLRVDAQGSAADLLAELRSGDGMRCMDASNSTSEYQEHYQTMASELADPLFAIVESGEGCVDSSISALLNLGPGIAGGVSAERAVPSLVTIVEAALEPNASYEQVSTAGTATLVIGYFGQQAGAAAPVLQRWISDAPDHHYRSYAVDSLGRIGDAAAPVVPAMLALLEPPAEDDEQAWEKNDLRASVIRMLGFVPAAIEHSGPALIATLRSGQDHFPYLAAESLTALGAPAAPYLVAALEDENPEVRAQVLAILIGMGAAAAEGAPRIATLLLDEDWNVSYQAAEAMLAIGPTPAGVAALVKVLEGGNQQAARSAAEILGSYGSGASDALPGLRKAAKSDDWMVSDAAKEAIAAIDGGV